MEHHLQSSITIIDASVMLLESSVMLLENIYKIGVTYDNCHIVNCHVYSTGHKLVC